MISINKNNKGELTEARGKRVKKSSLYSKNVDFELSRSKFNDFLLCKRCFYLDRVLGIKVPDMPGWTLNSTVDELLKKDIDKWRDALRGGIKHRYKDTNLIIKGGVDDIWFNKATEEIIIVDYKSQASFYRVNTEDYLSNVFHESYKVQMDIYAYLFERNDFNVAEISYFYVANCRKDLDGFNSKLVFDETLVPYRLRTHWIEPKIDEMLTTLNSPDLPYLNSFCQNCACSKARAECEY
jgi:CRISPR/Cas system-associated exonuclease Cas4 (RecB family)